MTVVVGIRQRKKKRMPLPVFLGVFLGVSRSTRFSSAWSSVPFVSRGKKLFETNGDWILMLECGIFCSSSDLLLVLRFARGDCTKVVCHECWIVPAVSRSACRSQKTTVLSKKSLSLRSDVLFASSEMERRKNLVYDEPKARRRRSGS